MSAGISAADASETIGQTVDAARTLWPGLLRELPSVQSDGKDLASWLCNRMDTLKLATEALQRHPARVVAEHTNTWGVPL